VVGENLKHIELQNARSFPLTVRTDEGDFILDNLNDTVIHETGHWLGRPHAFCSGPGNLAPVMQQQSKGMQGCRPNAWPLAREIRAVS
jgi:hypothetical protein